MKINMDQKPKGVTIVEGFPGFGLIGTITTEFLIDQLKAEKIGTIKFEEIPTMVAIHEGKVIDPIGLYYDKKSNLVIVHVVTSVTGIEWNLADAIMAIANDLKAKEIVSLEGVASQRITKQTNCFYYASNPSSESKFKEAGVEKLQEGIIVGVTGALLLQKEANISSIFAETTTGLPDSKAAAEIIKVLDKYLDLQLDPAPLMQQAEKFEKKLQTLLTEGKKTQETQMKKRLSYVG